MKALRTWLGRGAERVQGLVKVERVLAFPSKFLGNRRELCVFLPPGYGEARRRYPLLLVNDGQDLGDWKMEATLNRLYAEQRLAPLIVVGVEAIDRLDEYGTTGRANAQGLGGRAALYTRFVREELLPWLDKRYHLLREPRKRAIMGASLGGLSAFDIGWRHPDQFGAIGVFSGSFWWRSDDSSVQAKLASRIAHALVREPRRRAALRFWFEAGLYDETADRDGDGVIDAIQDTTELIDELVRCGYQRGADLVYRAVPGDHSPATWAEYLPEFLQWAFPA